MQPLALKNLWSITGKHGAATNAIYGATGNPLSPYLTDDSEPSYCLFEIGNRVGAKKAYLFDNEIRNGVQLWETVADRIREHCETGVLYTNCTHLEIAVIVFSAYYDVTVEDAMALNVRMVNKLPCWDLNGVRVYDLRKNNLVSDTVRSPTFSNAFIVRKHCDMAVICKGVAFWTEYDENLYSALQKIRDWTLNRGRAAEQKKDEIALVATLVADGIRTKISFAEIVWLYHHGLIDMNDFESSVVANREKLSKDSMVVDHMSQRRTNNFSWCLATIPSSLNTSLSDRDKIARPWYFMSVYDEAVQKFKVRLGNFDTGWERRYLFDDLAILGSNGEYVYSELLRKFKAAIGPQFIDNSRDSYLRYWSNPDLAHDPGNVLTDTLRTPVENYTDVSQLFSNDNWDDIHGIEPESE